jgi:hypothetical protein
MKRITAIILLILTTISCQNSKNEENQIKVLQQASLNQFFKNIQLVEDMKRMISQSPNPIQFEDYISEIKSLLQKRSKGIDISYDSIIVKSRDSLNNYQKYLLIEEESNCKFPILDNKGVSDLWYQILMVSEAEYNLLANKYAAKIGLRGIHCHFGAPLLYYFFAPDSIKRQKNSYLVFKRVDMEFPSVKRYTLSNVRVLKNEKQINLPFEITKVDDVSIFRFTPELKGKYTIKVFQKCEEEFEGSINWDRDVTFDFEVY